MKELRKINSRWNSLVINFSLIRFLSKGERDEKIR